MGQLRQLIRISELGWNIYQLSCNIITKISYFKLNSHYIELKLIAITGFLLFRILLSLNLIPNA